MPPNSARGGCRPHRGRFGRDGASQCAGQPLPPSAAFGCSATWLQLHPPAPPHGCCPPGPRPPPRGRARRHLSAAIKAGGKRQRCERARRGLLATFPRCHARGVPPPSAPRGAPPPQPRCAQRHLAGCRLPLRSGPRRAGASQLAPELRVFLSPPPPVPRRRDEAERSCSERGVPAGLGAPMPILPSPRNRGDARHHHRERLRSRGGLGLVFRATDPMRPPTPVPPRTHSPPRPGAGSGQDFPSCTGTPRALA